jgi:protein FAM32A
LAKKPRVEVHTIEKTAAQLKYEATMLARQRDDIAKGSELTHRDKIKKLNEKLSKLTEFNDIPRISAAGNG